VMTEIVRVVLMLLMCSVHVVGSATVKDLVSAAVCDTIR
jgi:hypothetical protein